MEGLYQSPSYAYLPQQNASAVAAVDNYHNMYRPNTAFDRPSFHNSLAEEHHHHNHHHHHQQQHNEIDSYHNWSSSSPHHHSSSHHSSSHQTPAIYGNYYSNNNASMLSSQPPRPKITTNLWEDEGTLCFQVDAKGICVARRQDNDMINGTKLLNVVGMSRGKRDGILKNEKGRVVVKVGAMHLKGVWIPFNRATELAEKFKILDAVYPLFVDEPSIYLCTSPIGGAAHNNNEVILPSPPPTSGAAAAAAKCNNNNMVSSPLPAFNRTDEYPSSSLPTNWDNNNSRYSSMNHHQHYSASSSTSPYDQVIHRNNSADLASGSSPVPKSMHHHHQQDENDLYLNNSNTPYDYYTNHRQSAINNRGSFSSTVSSHHSASYLYPVQQQHEDETSKSTTTPPTSVTTPTTSYDYHYGARNEKSPLYTSPYMKSSTSTFPNLSATAAAALSNHNHELNTSATATAPGSTTPSSWFSPETPTAVLFQQNREERSSNEQVQSSSSKKRKLSIVEKSVSVKKVCTSSVTSTLPPISSHTAIATATGATSRFHNDDDAAEEVVKE